MAQKKLSPVLAVTTIILLLSSCDLEFLDSHSSASDIYEICVHVYDDATDEFIDSAFVSISADKKVEELSFRETISGYTQKGEWCASFAHGYQLSMFTIGKKGYADQ